MIYVIATVELAEGKRSDYLKEVQKLVPKVRAEKGNLEYGAAIDFPTGVKVQEPIRPNVVVIMEKWADFPALQEHMKAPHMQEYRQAVKDMIVGMKLQVLEPA